MTAVSPYAPPRRNSLLRRRSSAIETGGGGSGLGTAVVAVFLLALRFWRDAEYRETARNLLRRRPLVFQWIRKKIQKLLLLENTSTSTRNSSSSSKSTDNNHDIKPQDPSIPKAINDNHLTYEQSALQLVQVDRIRENQKLIQKVLHFWFGRYSPDESQKNLWMIAHSSAALRQRVDQDIADQFESLLLQLAGSTSINTGTGTGSSTAEEPTERWTEWCHDGFYGFQGKVAAIVVLDQFSRHIQRHYESKTDDSSSFVLLPSKAHLDAWALKTAQLLVDDHADEIRCGMIPLQMYIFSLMPFRHASTIETVELVQQRIEKCGGLSTQLDAMLGRFRKATNRRMALLQDEARRTGNSKVKINEDDKNENDGSSPTTFSDEDILETFPFDADMTSARNHPVVKTIQAFLADQGIKPVKDGNHAGPATPIIISLSGGVDGMVIASALAHVHQSCGFHLDIWAVHIDYANRPESGAEADFVGRYCERLNISFRCRLIDEVTRGITARDDYERIARDLRYTSYKETLALAKERLKDHDNAIGVMLGHHRGDLRENVLSNAHKGCGPLDLSGMTAVSRNDGVVIYRPLLPLEKSFIFDYAHKFGVPYFKDTTPHWSTRGKLRNQLIPLLEEIYGEGSMKNLSNLAVESDECRALLQNSMIGPFLNRIKRRPMGIVFETAPWKNQAVFFWKFVLREALHSASFGMFSDKSVLSFLERVQAPKLRSGWLQCRRDYAVYLQEDGQVYVLYPSSFPFAKNDMYGTFVGQAVPYDKETRVGPWVVKSEIISEKADCPETFRLAQKALPSMEHLMDGKIEYVVDAPTWEENGKFVPRPLVFTRFTKTSRPSAWKNNENNRNLYLKVQETLPLLGNDESAQAAYADAFDGGCIHEVNGEQQVNPKRLVRVTLSLQQPNEARQ